MSDELKKVIEKEFDKEKNYNTILSKIERIGIMKKTKNKCALASACAIVLVITIFVNIKTNTGNIIENKNNTENNEQKNGISIEMEWNVYSVNKLSKLDMDIVYDEYIEPKTQENLEKFLNDFKNDNNLLYIKNISSEFNLANFYKALTRGTRLQNPSRKYKVHDYIFEYNTSDNGKIIIAICAKEKPLSEYFFEFEGKKSKISNTELEISKYENMYIVNFEHENFNYNIRTQDVTEEELMVLLKLIILNNAC